MLFIKILSLLKKFSMKIIKLKTEWHMTDLPKITSFSVLKKMVHENKKIDSDPMRLFVLLLYETSICSEPNWISWLTHQLLTLYSMTWSRATLPPAIIVIPMVLLREKCPCNIMQEQRCMLTNAWRVNSAIDCS